DASHGNAIGIGMADFAHSRLIDKIDYPSLYTNAVTSCTPFGAAVPVHFGSDRTAVESALQTIGLVEPGQVRIVRIRNTLELQDLLVSVAFREEIEGRTELQIIEEPSDGESAGLMFDRNGNLSPFPLSEKWRNNR
ncbi:MAG TPA: hypothetical protein VMX75_08640, partial [Spirochaetia bacterium]|nr:hypothetical protein [Spirochaetia bacterium]